MRVCDLIPVGSEHPITRAELVHLTGLSDRRVRKEIEEMRMMFPIVNLQDGKGYYIADSSDDVNLKRYVKQENNRIKSINRSLNTARELLGKHKSKDKQLKGQMSLFEVVT